jgi:predicted GNAT superfamily acetyltransferase
MALITYTPNESPFEPNFVNALHALAAELFGDIDEEDLVWRLSRMPDASVQAAYDGSTLIGFKFGYALTKSRYYSWLTGVDPQYRRQGVARQLLVAQHDWARRHRYATIETSALRSDEVMLRLNLSFHFQIIGTYSRETTPRVMMLKRL